MPASRTPRLLSVITLLLLAALIHSGISPYDRTTWLMEVAPVLIVLPLLWLTHRRYPLTPLLYTLIFFHALILIFGGMYSYARVPLGFEVQQWLGLGRNPYDKLGHFFQGLVPALALGQGADEFLGTQGDPWDTQSDMFCALLGAMCGLLLFGRWQDRQIVRLG